MHWGNAQRAQRQIYFLFFQFITCWGVCQRAGSLVFSYRLRGTLWMKQSFVTRSTTREEQKRRVWLETQGPVVVVVQGAFHWQIVLSQGEPSIKWWSSDRQELFFIAVLYFEFRVLDLRRLQLGACGGIYEQRGDMLFWAVFWIIHAGRPASNELQ